MSILARTLYPTDLIEHCTFKWSDLDEKELRIKTIENEGIKLVYGVETIWGAGRGHRKYKFYLLHEEVIE